MKALIVEDDLSTRLIIKKASESTGYEVLEAENGIDGWKIFQKEKNNIYIAILDWMMPVSNIKAEYTGHCQGA
jgi:DNA-binding response OmpR family regulator